jgi:hypothetical protein
MLPTETSYYKLDLAEGAEDLILVFPGFTESEGRFGSPTRFSGVRASRLQYTNMRPEWATGGIPALVESIPGMLEELRLLIAQSGAKRVYSFGFSFGAFGALLFGLLLKAERIVAVSGQTALGMPGTRSARLLGRRLDLPYTDLRKVALEHPPKEAHLLYGERDAQDLLSAIHMVGVPGLRLHFFRGAAHTLPGDLRRAGVPHDLLADTVSGRGLLDKHPRRIDFELKPRMAEWIRTGFDALAENDPFTAEEAFRALARAIPGSAMAWHNLGHSLRLQSRWAEAVEAYQRAMALDADDATLMSYAAQAMARTGRQAEALALCDQGLAISPGQSRLTRIRQAIASRQEQPAMEDSAA